MEYFLYDCDDVKEERDNLTKNVEDALRKEDLQKTAIDMLSRNREFSKEGLEKHLWHFCSSSETVEASLKLK